MDEHHISERTRMADTMKWLAERGFIGAVVSNDRTDAPGVLLVGKPGWSPIMATVGNTLVWDDNALSVRT
jgi:hypothetical protein